MTTPRKSQAGLTLIEFMVSIAIGMLLIAAIAMLIANQSGTRRDLDQSGRMIENGRYAVRVIAEDAQLAGYWGELSTVTVPGALPDPCSVTAADLDAAMGIHVQGYDASATAFPTCISSRLAGTDVLVVRHADPDHSDLMTGAAVDFAKVKVGQAYLQTGLDATGLQFASVLAVASGVPGTDSTTFNLKKKDKTTIAPPRKVHVHIYYISSCSVEVSGSCASGDAGNPIPTLKRVDLAVTGGAVAMSSPVTIAEGIENLQVDYGVDSDATPDGAPNGADLNGTTLTTPADWANVMTLKIHLLARTSEPAVGYVDNKTYAMGTAGSVGPFNNSYKRHAFVQSVRLVNPIMRRAP